MAPSLLQNGGFILGLIGGAALIAATAMNNWSVKDRQGDVVTSVYTYKGLWQDCETTSSGFNECRPLYGLLGFSGNPPLFLQFPFEFVSFPFCPNDDKHGENQPPSLLKPQSWICLSEEVNTVSFFSRDNVRFSQPQPNSTVSDFLSEPIRAWLCYKLFQTKCRWVPRGSGL